ncbi:MAG: hypothetical protein V4726_19890 [Verrucomicrobiota bacterium]
MYEISGLQRRIESLEYELRLALTRLDHLEAMLREEDHKVARLERSFEHDHKILERHENGIPVGL